jgi:superfamily II DNA or RNA helicase
MTNTPDTPDTFIKIRETSYLSKRGYVLRKDQVDTKEIAHLKKTLWGKPLQDTQFNMYGNVVKFPLFVETKNKLYIPKMYGISRYGVPDGELPNYSGVDWDSDVAFTGQLYEHQVEPVELLMAELQNGSSGGILSLATGGGKSISCLAVLARLRKKTLIVVNKIALMKQWESEIKAFLPDASIGFIQGQKKVDVAGKHIVIGMLQSLAKIDYPDSLFEDYACVVYDEIHNTSCRVFSKVLMRTCSKYTIGLSATPQRSDGCEYVFRWFVGDVVYKSSSERRGLPPVVNTVKLTSSEYREISTINRITGNNQIQFTSMLSELVAMPKRNRLIVEMIKHYVADEDRRLLVLSDRREHLKTIKRLFDEDLSVTFTYGLFLGQMKIADLEKSKASQVILATYQAFGEGVSERDLDTLFLITPKKFVGHLKTVKNESGKLEQIVGRIFRKDHTNKSPLIVDFNDHFSVYKNQSRQRLAFYKSHFKTLSFREQMIDLDEHAIDKIGVDLLVSTTGRKGRGRGGASASSTSKGDDDIEHESKDDKSLSEAFYSRCLL